MSKQNVLVIIAFVAMLGVVGCNDSDKATAPLAPVGDTVAPVAVEELKGDVELDTNPAIHLSWKSGPELDLAGYRVYRSTLGGTSELVATTTQAIWIDDSVQMAANYRYDVSAFDDSNNESVRASTATLFTVETPSPAHNQNID